MGRLSGLAEGIEALKTGKAPAKKTDMVVGLQSDIDYTDLTPALAELQKTLEESAAKRDQSLESAVKAMSKVMDTFRVNVAAPEVNIEAVLPVEELVESIKEMMPEQKPVKFDIERDGNGFMKSVIATPI